MNFLPDRVCITDIVSIFKVIETVVPSKQESEYQEILQRAVAVIEESRSKAAHAIVSTSNEMHWNIGKLLFEKKLESKHGDQVVKRLSVDLKAIYPKMGMSVSNLWAMKKYYGRFYLSDPKLQRSVGVLPWRHINQLMTKLKDDDNAIQYYAERTVAKGWKCEILLNAIKMQMHLHQPERNTTNNFEQTLPATQAAYANDVFKDTYYLGFTGTTEKILELELERRLFEKIKQFLLELGKGFTYIGNQHVLSYNGKDYKVDMLFFHRGLRSSR